MSISPVTSNSVQTCPHGAAPGVCPICSGMGGGGGKTKKADTQPKNEMSYAQCYAIWTRMKAAERREMQAENAMQRQAEFLANTQKMLAQMTEKLLNTLSKIENILPTPLKGMFAATVNNILKPIMNFIVNFPNFVSDIGKFLQNMQREIYIVAEKLASVFGEIKNFIKEKVSETFKKFTKKVYKILNIFGLFEEDNFEEDERVSTELAVFKAKDVVSIKEFLIKLAGMERKEKDEHITGQPE